MGTQIRPFLFDVTVFPSTSSDWKANKFQNFLENLSRTKNIPQVSTRHWHAKTVARAFPEITPTRESAEELLNLDARFV